MNNKISNSMTVTWPEVRRHFSELPTSAWTTGMLALIDHISESHLAGGLFPWASAFDLCLAQVPATYPYDGPYLRISPIQDGRFEFRYIDTMVAEKQWAREVEAADTVQRFDSFVRQLSWSMASLSET